MKVIGDQHDPDQSKGKRARSVTAAMRKGKSSVNQFTRRMFVGQFFGLGVSAREAARRTGHPLSDGEEEIRRIGYREWQRRTSRMEL